MSEAAVYKGQNLFGYMWYPPLPEHVSGAERPEFQLLAHASVRSLAPSLKVEPDSSALRPLSAHLKFHSAPVKSLHARSNEGAMANIFHRIASGTRCPMWPELTRSVFVSLLIETL